jgi:transcriptional regulator with XRE-family HTH domain
MGNLVREMLDMAQLSVMDAAVYSGVPKSNIYRYLSGEAEPTLAVLEEIARACDLSLDIAPKRLSDPYAAQAVKNMLEPSDTEAPSEVLSWIERITRRHPHNDYDVIHIGGVAAAPTYRHGAHYFRGDIHTLTVASAGDFTNKNWALSGAPVLEALDLSGAFIPVVLWAEDADLAAAALKQSATELPHPDGANILIVPAHHGECDGSIAMAGVRLVSVLQGLIDVVSFGDEAAGLVRTYLEREV